jgi:5'-nucleotidase
MAKPNVLVSNDDGISAPGLAALVDALATAQICNLHVVAPATEQSAKSQALTLGQPFVATEHDCHPKACSCFALHGTPADSVRTALGSPLLGVRNLFSAQSEYSSNWHLSALLC